MRYILTLALLIATEVSAAPLRWHFVDTTYGRISNSTGEVIIIGDITGYFDYDALNNSYSNVSITIGNPPSIIFDGDINIQEASLVSNSQHIVLDYKQTELLDGTIFGNRRTGSLALNLLLMSPLVSTGGIVQIQLSDPNFSFFDFAYCPDSECTYLKSGSNNGFIASVGYSNIFSGHLIAIPIPPALWLFGTALFSLIGLRRKAI